MHPAIIIGTVRSLIVDVVMGQIPRSTERISSFGNSLSLMVNSADVYMLYSNYLYIATGKDYLTNRHFYKPVESTLSYARKNGTVSFWNILYTEEHTEKMVYML